MIARLRGRALGQRRGRVRLVRADWSQRGVRHSQLSQETVEPLRCMARLSHSFPSRGRETTVDEGTTLLEAARAANVYVGGDLRRRRNVRQVPGDRPRGRSRGQRRGILLPATRFATGTCWPARRCRWSDLVVEVPPESRLTGYVGIVQDSERFRDFVRSEAERAAGGARPAGAEVLSRAPRADLGRPYGRPGAGAASRGAAMARPAANRPEGHAGVASSSCGTFLPAVPPGRGSGTAG